MISKQSQEYIIELLKKSFKRKPATTQNGKHLVFYNSIASRVKTALSNAGRVGWVSACHSSKFHGIDCLEDESRYGFFKSVNDVRPGHASWVHKSDAEKLYNLFRENNETKN
jgi:hypothetical protein